MENWSLWAFMELHEGGKCLIQVVQAVWDSGSLLYHKDSVCSSLVISTSAGVPCWATGTYSVLGSVLQSEEGSDCMWGKSVLRGETGRTPHPWLSLEELENSSLLNPGTGGLGKEEVWEHWLCWTEDGGLNSDLASLVVMLMKTLCAVKPELGRLYLLYGS